MGCDCCKEISPSDYSKCQQDMVRILRNRGPKSFRQYNAPCGKSYTFGVKITMPKKKKRKNMR